MNYDTTDGGLLVTFGAVFPRAFRPAFGPGLAAAGAAWWLTGGVAAANAVAVYLPKGAASLAASYVNLANPGTYDAAPGVAPTFDAATGWTVSSGQWLSSSGFTVANDQTSSIMVRFSDTATSSRGFLVGFMSEYGIQPYFDGTVKFFRSRSASQVSYAPIATSGVIATAGLANYLDGALLGNHITRSAGADLTAMAMGCQSVSSPGNYFVGKIQAVAFYNLTLTSTQVGLISTAMAAL